MKFVFLLSLKRINERQFSFNFNVVSCIHYNITEFQRIFGNHKQLEKRVKLFFLLEEKNDLRSDTDSQFKNKKLIITWHFRADY